MTRLRMLCHLCILAWVPILSTSTQELATKCVENADVVFIIDSSSSIRANNPADESTDNWATMKHFVSELVRRLPVDDGQIRVGVVQFATTVNRDQLVNIDNGLSDLTLQQRIQALPFMNGNTNTSGALRVARQYMFSRRRTNASSIALLLTDGLSNIDAHRTLAEARETKNAGIRMFTVGITPEANGDELHDIASDPVDYHHFMSPDFSHLNLLQDRLLSHLCTHKPPPAIPCRDHRTDVVFIMDDSGSIAEKNPDGTSPEYNWNLLKNFVISVVQRLTIGLNDTRIAIIRYSTTAEVIMQLNSSGSGIDLVRRINHLKYLSGGTNTSGALRLARNSVFKEVNGDRPGVRNIAIIITDGESTVDRNLTVPEALEIKDDGVRMFAIGITNYVIDEELNAIASTPTKEHVYRVEHFNAVEKLVSRLVWKICNDRISQGESVCASGSNLIWHRFPGQLIVGHNAARLTDVSSATECERLCLRQPACRSIDYATSILECAISHDSRLTASESFLYDPGVDYYEWDCVVGGNKKETTTAITTPDQITTTSFNTPSSVNDVNAPGSGSVTLDPVTPSCLLFASVIITILSFE